MEITKTVKPKFEPAPVVMETMTFAAPESYTGAWTTDEKEAVARVNSLLAPVGWREKASAPADGQRRSVTWTRAAALPPDEPALYGLVVATMRTVNWTRLP